MKPTNLMVINYINSSPFFLREAILRNARFSKRKSYRSATRSVIRDNRDNHVSPYGFDDTEGSSIGDTFITFDRFDVWDSGPVRRYDNLCTIRRERRILTKKFMEHVGYEVSKILGG